MPLRMVLIVAGLVLAVQPAVAQVTGLRRASPQAFPLAVVPWASLGFNGTRVVEHDPLWEQPELATCPTRRGRDCFQYQLGDGPMVGADLQVPLPSTFGLQLSGAAGRPSRVICTRGQACSSIEDLTSVRASAMLLIRIKARAPIFFGLGGALHRVDPGPVLPLQDSLTVTEVGGIGTIGYDFAMGSRVGGRISWVHYFLKPSDDGLSEPFEAKSLAHDWLLAVGARIKLMP